MLWYLTLCSTCSLLHEQINLSFLLHVVAVDRVFLGTFFYSCLSGCPLFVSSASFFKIYCTGIWLLLEFKVKRLKGKVEILKSPFKIIDL